MKPAATRGGSLQSTPHLRIIEAYQHHYGTKQKLVPTPLPKNPRPRMPTEPDSRHLYPFLSKELIHANLRKKLETEPVSLRPTIRLSGQASKHQQDGPNSQRKMVEQKELRCEHCEEMRRKGQENTYIKEQLKMVLQAQSQWKDCGVGARETVSKLGLETPETGGSIQEMRCCLETFKMLWRLKQSFGEMVLELQSLSKVDRQDLLQFDTQPKSKYKEEYVEDILRSAELKNLFDELREEASVFASRQQGGVGSWRDPRGADDMLRRRITRTQCKLEHYVRQNIMLRAKQDVGVACDDEEINIAVNLVLAALQTGSASGGGAVKTAGKRKTKLR